MENIVERLLVVFEDTQQQAFGERALVPEMIEEATLGDADLSSIDVEGWHYETWVYEHSKNTWRKMNPNVEPPGGGQRRRIMVAIPDQNVILMENYVNPSQKIAGVVVNHTQLGLLSSYAPYYAYYHKKYQAYYTE